MLVAAFLLLGLLVGNLAGLTSAAVTLPLIAAMFAFVGTSAIAFLDKVQSDHRASAARMIVGISIGCLTGVYTGILVREHRWLSPNRTIAAVADSVGAGSLTAAGGGTGGYLRGTTVTEAEAINRNLQAGRISAQDAYDSLFAIIHRKSAP